MNITNNRYIEKRNAERFSSACVVELPEGLGITKDLSSTGVYFVTPHQLNAGSLLKFYILLQKIGNGVNKLCCEGQVIRAHKNAKEWEVAVKFLNFGFEYNPV